MSPRKNQEEKKGKSGKILEEKEINPSPQNESPENSSLDLPEEILEIVETFSIQKKRRTKDD